MGSGKEAMVCGPVSLCQLEHLIVSPTRDYSTFDSWQMILLYE